MVSFLRGKNSRAFVGSRSKALLSAAGRVREMGDAKHLAEFGITTGGVQYDREKVAAHANGLASKVRDLSRLAESGGTVSRSCGSGECTWLKPDWEV